MEQRLVNSNTESMSEDIRAIAAAFLLAKQEFSVTGRSGKADRYKYAKIEDIYHAVEEALAKNNILIWHFARPDHRAGCQDRELLYTRLIHTPTGQFVEDCRVMESEKPGNQEKGKANTYMKRYALLSLCAIPTEDDDCQAEQKYIEEPYITPEQMIFLQKEIKAAANGLTLLNNICSFNKVRELAQLKGSSFEGVKSYIMKNKE